MSKSAGSTGSHLDMKAERDRFVAFAFSAADAFLEIDASRAVRYAVGATIWLTGEDGGALLGRPFLDLVARRDRRLVRAALSTAERQGRFGPINVRIKRSGDKPAQVALFGTYLPLDGGRIFMALSAARLAVSAAFEDSDRDAESGLLNREAFADIAHEALRAGAEQGRGYAMTLLDMGGLERLQRQLGAAAGDFAGDLAAQLQAYSVDGASAGRIEGQVYGILHDDKLNVGEIEQSLTEQVRSADPEGRGIALTAATVTLLDRGLDEEDCAETLRYTLDRFCRSAADFIIDTLDKGYRLMVSERRQRLAALRETIAEGRFEVVFQPIVELSTRFVHHYEALARFDDDDPEASPYAFISYAEEAGVIGDFDLAMCQKVIARILQARDQGDIISLAVNLSGRSLSDPGFVARLHELLKSCGAIREELLFEVTESSRIRDLEATNQVLQGLRRLGHHVCLDDFGAGAAAFEYLRALDVDMVKIDGIYVQEALTTRNGKAFLRAMATLCRDLGIQTVAEMVEEEEQAHFLLEAGVRFGQGYLYGRPADGLSSTQHLAAS
ncbi:MAG: bifunctional diguanylate cyclase/phosphodiesterase [Alphaproteobacteria bacterium]|jgi:EAL domain-containing protein (putative c-di-GMP-specific phosphodiesterase class I)/GGDEF domain-containing protein|nr:bifunctional diguanylate cyclase/phosphodiesterase [Alphaproteobacteria bacterium]HJP19974.1 bifunctional diguanylate cyclase/phosphodiesterase [Alphaproteobacteria bacterium]